MEPANPVAAAHALVGAVTGLDALDPLDGYAAAMTASVDVLLADGADPLDVTQAVAEANDALTRRLLRLAECALGPPPYAYAWLALGSHGRGEQVLSSDQDSALAYGGPRLGPGDPATYFAQLSRVVVDGLERAGIPRCPGGYMATSWRLPLETFETQFRQWVNDPQPAELLKAEVFLDVRRVDGDLDTGGLLAILGSGARRPRFLLQMARAAVAFHPPHILLGRVQTQHGLLDLKRGGTAAIVLLARLYALAVGAVEPRTTLLRLEAAAKAGVLSRVGANQLLDGYRLLTGLRLRHQVRQVRAGVPPDDRMSPRDLSPAERRAVRDAIVAVRAVQEVTARRYPIHGVT